MKPDGEPTLRPGTVDSDEYEGEYDLSHWELSQVFAPGEVAEWESALNDLRMLLRMLERADIHDPEDMAEVEELVEYEIPRLSGAFADAFDSASEGGER